MLNPGNYRYDKILKEYRYGEYPGERSDKWSIPDDIKTVFSQLNSIIETKYTREYLKICSFYNKMFPSLKNTGYLRSSYNVQPFTVTDQERQDTGTGISYNYLKQIVDQTVSRIGTISFDPMLLADIPTLEYILYKEDIERLLRRAIRNEDMSLLSTECFHDAAILGYAHVLINPWTRKFSKVNDYELGVFESQFNKGKIRQLLFRDYAYPVTELSPYLYRDSNDEDTIEKIKNTVSGKDSCDLKLYFDTISHKAYCTINNTTLSPISYDFDYVQLITFCWDTGFSKVTSTSLFDLLYPVQRELNKVNAKLQQLIRLYKGPVPVFNSDVDLAMKAISNSSGEALYVDSQRSVDSLMTVINPTPLDPTLSAEINNYKTAMYELAGIQQVSFDMENMRSAAAVIALDQTRDTVFQCQMDGIANFIKRLFIEWVHFNKVNPPASETDVDWGDVDRLVNEAVIELKPVHLNDPLGNKATAEGAKPADYTQMLTARIVRDVFKGRITFDMLPITCDIEDVKMIMATTIVKYDALGSEIPDCAWEFMISAFIDDVKKGVTQFTPPTASDNPAPPTMDEAQPTQAEVTDDAGQGVEGQGAA